MPSARALKFDSPLSSRPHYFHPLQQPVVVPDLVFSIFGLHALLPTGGGILRARARLPRDPRGSEQFGQAEGLNHQRPS